jgi:hypothetical protein
VITFNAPVDPVTASRPENFRLLPESRTAEREDDKPWPIASAVVDAADPTRVILTLDESYPIGALGRNFTVTITGVLSADGREINGGEGSTVGFTLESTDLASLRVYPQPFSIERDGIATFAGLPRDARVEILTQSGAHVRSLKETEHNGGVPWDGRDDAGAPVATGIYLYRVTVRSGAETLESDLGKIAVVR